MYMLKFLIEVVSTHQPSNRLSSLALQERNLNCKVTCMKQELEYHLNFDCMKVQIDTTIDRENDRNFQLTT